MSGPRGADLQHADDPQVAAVRGDTDRTSGAAGQDVKGLGGVGGGVLGDVRHDVVIARAASATSSCEKDGFCGKGRVPSSNITLCCGGLTLSPVHR